MELLAAFAKHAASSDCRMGPLALRRRRRTRRTAPRRSGEFAGAGQARSGGERPLARAGLGESAAAGTRVDFGARGAAAPAIGGADWLGDGGRAGSAGGAGVRRSALGRSDDPRRSGRHGRAGRAGAFVHRGDDAARVPATLGHALASRQDLVVATRLPAGAGDGGGALSAARAAARGGGGRSRAHWRRAAIRRGSDAPVVGAWWARRHPIHPADAATIADGATRPTRPGARGGAGRIGDWTGLLLWPAARGGRYGGRAVADGAGTAGGSRHPAGRGLAA